MSIRKKDIPEIARQAGLKVVSEKNSAFVDIYRKGRKTPTIRIWQDGEIHRADVDLHLTVNMSIADALEALGLKA